MWVTSFGPLVVVFFLAGMTVAAVLLRLGKLRSPRSALAAVALPFGCAALPVVGLAMLSLAASVFTSNSLALYAELFGPGAAFAAVPDRSRMLFEAVGTGATREVLLRLDANLAEREQLLALPGLRPAAMTPVDFARLGTRHRLDGWWMRPTAPGVINRLPGTDCLSPTIYQADGFNGWRQLRLALCAPDRGATVAMFVSAYGR